MISWRSIRIFTVKLFVCLKLISQLFNPSTYHTIFTYSTVIVSSYLFNPADLTQPFIQELFILYFYPSCPCKAIYSNDYMIILPLFQHSYLFNSWCLSFLFIATVYPIYLLQLFILSSFLSQNCLSYLCIATV